jgi:arginine-tRNA-protein transferase
MPEGHGGRQTQDATPVSGDAERYAPLTVPPQHFYRTAALPCPYLGGRLERKLVTELAGRDAAAFYNALSRAGFRRSHNLAYRPACSACQDCLPVRIPVADFTLSRSLKRIRNLNRDLTARVAPPVVSVEQFRLFLRYQRLRHADSDMAAMTYGDYRAMVEDSPVVTRLVELHDAARALRGACLVDLLDDGLSAVYSFYDPEDGNRSLGNMLVLALVDEARRRRLPYVYLGYLVEDSSKMAYKARFRPLESLAPGGWRRLIG